jgi:vitamin B12 transporter
VGGSKSLGYSADASHLSTDGTYAFNNGYHNTVLSGSVRAAPDPKGDASLSVRFSDNRFHFPTDFSGVLADSNQFNAEKALSLGAEVGRRLSDRVELRVSGGGGRSDGEFDDRPDNAADTVGFGFASHRNSRDQRGNLEARVNGFVSSVLTLTTGMQVERETERQSGETTSNFGGIATTPDTPFDRGRTTFGYYAQGVLALPGGLAVNVNGRLDHNSGFGTFFTYRAGLAYQLLGGTRLRGSLGSGFKAPAFCEQFCDAPFVVGDSTLQPERSNSWELGVEQHLAGPVSLWATYFDQRFRDMIVYDGSVAPGEPTYRNGAAALARGVETGVTTSFGASLSAKASYTYLDTKATDDAGMPSASFANGQRLIRRPGHSAELAVQGRVFERATLGGSLTYVGRRDDVDFNAFPSVRVELPDYAIVDLAAEVDVLQPGAGRPGLSGVVRVENLFDQRYDQVVGFAGRPRGIYGGARFRF